MFCVGTLLLLLLVEFTDMVEYVEEAVVVIATLICYICSAGSLWSDPAMDMSREGLSIYKKDIRICQINLETVTERCMASSASASTTFLQYATPRKQWQDTAKFRVCIVCGVARLGPFFVGAFVTFLFLFCF